MTLNVVLEQLTAELDTAQNELIEAEQSLLLLAAAADDARVRRDRLKAAVAALSGESPAAPSVEVPGSDATEEEIDAWEAERKKKLRAREKELMAQNPLASIKCSGCGIAGHLVETMIKAPSGAPLKAVVCQSCGNQTFV